MNVFIATQQTQGLRRNDFCYCVSGELVRLPARVCCNPTCGCDSSMAGLASSKATTTFAVIDRRDLDPSTYTELFVHALTREGWIGPRGGMTVNEAKRWAKEHLDLAASFEPGSVLEIQGAEIRVRGMVAGEPM